MKTLLVATTLVLSAALPAQAQVAPSAAEAVAYQGLHAAAHKGDLGAIKQLIAAKADLNARDPYGRTPLHVASFARHREAIRLLAAAGADLNLLERAKRELGAAFPADGFEHLAFYNPAYRRIEMHLRAARPLALRLGRETYLFGQGETLHTENSHKYTVEGFQAMAARAGFRPGKVWTDANHWFAVLWLEAPHGGCGED